MRAFTSLLLVLSAIALSAAEDSPVSIIRALTDEARIATLKSERACNDRLLKILYWMHSSKVMDSELDVTLDAALNGHSRPKMTKEALLRNYRICEALGLLTNDNLDLMRRGKSPSIMRGPYEGEPAEVDHILPLSVFPQFAREFWNLELMPRTLNRRKGSTVGDRQRALLRQIEAKDK